MLTGATRAQLRHLQPGGVSGEFEDSDDAHDPEELSDPANLGEVASFGVGADQGDADVVRQHRQQVDDVHRILDKLAFVRTAATTPHSKHAVRRQGELTI